MSGLIGEKFKKKYFFFELSPFADLGCEKFVIMISQKVSQLGA